MMRRILPSSLLLISFAVSRAAFAQMSTPAALSRSASVQRSTSSYNDRILVGGKAQLSNLNPSFAHSIFPGQEPVVRKKGRKAPYVLIGTAAGVLIGGALAGNLVAKNDCDDFCLNAPIIVGLSALGGGVGAVTGLLVYEFRYGNGPAKSPGNSAR